MAINRIPGARAGLRNVIIAAWLTLALPTVAAAEQAVGRVLSSVGEFVAVRPDDSRRQLQRRDPVYSGDTLHTGGRGRAQIRFIDQGLVDLRPNTVFRIDRYEAAGEEQGGAAVMTFVTGAMRTVTGSIGGDDRDDYRVESAVATIGVRGTDYSLQFCAADCASQDRPEGLYGRVDEGGITVTNETGTSEFGAGHYFHVEDDATPPQLLTTPPPSILDGNDDGDAGGEDEEDETEESDSSAIREDDDEDEADDGDDGDDGDDAEDE